MTMHNDRISRLQLSGLGLLLAVWALLTLLPLINVGHVTKDDMHLGSLHQSSALLRGAMHNSAVLQGRFHFLISFPLLAFPYIFESLRIAHAIGLATIALAAFLLADILRKMGLRTVSYLVFAMFLLTATNTNEHSLYSAYPFAFSFGLSVVFLATRLELFAVKRSLVRSVAIVGLFFLGICAMNEFSIIYVLLPFTLARFIRPSGANGTPAAVKPGVHLCNPLLAAGLFLACYLGYRMFAHPSTYEGNVMAFQGVGNFLQVVYQYTIAGVPGYLSLFLNPDVVLSRLSVMNLTLSPGVLCVGLCAGLLPFFVFERIDEEDEIGTTRLVLLLVVMLGFAVFPQMLLGMTEKYVRWVTISNSKSYCTSFFSMVFIAVLLALGLAKSYSLLARCGRSVLIGFKIVLSVVFCGLAVSNSLWNQSFSRDQFLMQERWDLVDTLLCSDKRSALTRESVVIAPSLFEPKGIAVVPPWYWSQYFSYKLGHPVTVVQTVADALKAVKGGAGGPWFLVHTSTPSLEASAIIFAPLGRPNGALARRALTVASVYVHAVETKTGLIFRQADQVNTDDRDGGLAGVVGLLQFNVKSGTWSDIRSRRPFYADSLELTTADPVLLKPTTNVSYGVGFFGAESSPTDIWRWSIGKSELIVDYYDWRPGKVELEFTLGTYAVSRTVEIVFHDQVIKTVKLMPGAPSNVVLSLRVKPGANPVTLSSAEPAPAPSATEPRGLTFGVFNPKLK